MSRRERDDSDRHVEAVTVKAGPRSEFALGSLLLVIDTLETERTAA